MNPLTAIASGPYGMLIALPGYLLLAIFSYNQVPKKWMKETGVKTGIIIFHVLGMISLVSLTLWYCYFPESLLKWIHLIFHTFYFNFIILSSALLFIRWVYRKIRHKGKDDENHPMNKLYIWGLVILFIGLYTFMGVYNVENIQHTTYKVEPTKEAAKNVNAKFMYYGDSHIGAGANIETIGFTSDMINMSNADALILDGDIVDGSTSQDELEYLKNSLKNIKTKYGVYFVTGNHDDNCLFDYRQYLVDGGVKIIDNQAVKLPNGTILVGRDYREYAEPIDIMRKSGLTEADWNNNEVVLAMHRPESFNEFKDQCDVMLNAHTHGYAYPILLPNVNTWNENKYGAKQYGNMTAITTSGLSTWGFHTKWPSMSEIVEVDICK